MPDEHSAATEHALIQEIAEPLASLPEDPVAVAAASDFPIVLRGYDRVAVDAYVAKTAQLIAELQTTRSPEAAVRRALERVGEQVSGVLQRAHEAADELTSKSRSEAEDRLESARVEAEQVRSGALESVKELDAETDRIWAERRRIIDDIEDLSRRLVALAESAGERFPADDGDMDSAPPTLAMQEAEALPAVEVSNAESVAAEPEPTEGEVPAPTDQAQTRITVSGPVHPGGDQHAGDAPA